jgi:glc operon protein GlcG
MKSIWRALAAPALPWLSVSAASAQPASPLVAQQTSVTAEGARRALGAAEKEATRRGLKLSIAVVDAAGHLLAFQRMDNARLITVDVAIGKARTAAYLRSPSKALEETINGGRAALLAIERIMPVQGAVPIIVDGAVVGAIGASGASPADDELVAKAGAETLSKTAE